MSFSEFYQRSINEPEQFWAEQARRIDWQTPFTQTLDHSNPPFARWFCEGRTNLCHNAIDRWLEKQPEALALIAVSSETEEERTFTFRQLHDEVNAVASMLRSLGVQRGDRVLVYMPMIAEAHITLLACARIGAIHSVVFGGFASHSVAARIDDAKPVLIVSADAGARGGKIIPYKKIARRCDKSGAAPATPCFAGGSRTGENGARQRAGCRFRVVALSTHRRAGTSGVAGIQRNLLHSLHFRHDRQT
ncbi:propionate--coA ligase [Escherichia coli]|nr:propionate--coA ligase [Escherichia coli]